MAIVEFLVFRNQTSLTIPQNRGRRKDKIVLFFLLFYFFIIGEENGRSSRYLRNLYLQLLK